jgi:hypothetical protein
VSGLLARGGRARAPAASFGHGARGGAAAGGAEGPGPAAYDVGGATRFGADSAAAGASFAAGAGRDAAGGGGGRGGGALTPGPGAYDVAGLLPDANRARAPAFSLGYGKR